MKRYNTYDSFIYAIMVLTAFAFVGADISSISKSEPAIEIVKTAPSECKDSVSWECRRVERDGMQCIYKYCVNPSMQKTVESHGDLRGIYCFEDTS